MSHDLSMVVEHCGRPYTFELNFGDDGRIEEARWFDQNYAEPPTATLEKLFRLLSGDHGDELHAALAGENLRMFARILNNGNAPDQALPFLESYLAAAPTDVAAHAVLCSVLRKMGRPKEAIERTNIRHHNAALSTSRAAAYLDLDEPAAAKKEADRAKAMLRGRTSPMLIAVYKRLKERPSMA